MRVSTQAMCLYICNSIRRDLHHVTGSVINCERDGQLAKSSDQCCHMHPGLCSSAVGPVAQWQERLASIWEVPGSNPGWILGSQDLFLSPKPIPAFIHAYIEHSSPEHFN